MEKINVSVEKYSGSMDLLLNLIEKNKLDIYDIPLEKITSPVSEEPLLVRPQQAQQTAEQRGLPGAVRAQQAHHAPRGQGEGYVFAF